MGVEAFDQIWGVHNNYVNAPFCLLPKIIDLIYAQQMAATVIASVWTGQPWFQSNIATAECGTTSQLPKHTRDSNYIRNRNNKWYILAWRMSGHSAQLLKIGQKRF